MIVCSQLTCEQAIHRCRYVSMSDKKNKTERSLLQFYYAATVHSQTTIKKDCKQAIPQCAKEVIMKANSIRTAYTSGSCKADV